MISKQRVHRRRGRIGFEMFSPDSDIDTTYKRGRYAIVYEAPGILGEPTEYCYRLDDDLGLLFLIAQEVADVRGRALVEDWAIEERRELVKEFTRQTDPGHHEDYRPRPVSVVQRAGEVPMVREGEGGP